MGGEKNLLQPIAYIIANRIVNNQGQKNGNADTDQGKTDNQLSLNRGLQRQVGFVQHGALQINSMGKRRSLLVIDSGHIPIHVD